MMKVTKFAGPRWTQARADERKADIAAAKAERGTGNNVAALRDRVDRLERILNLYAR
jgi:hypothetical protein